MVDIDSRCVASTRHGRMAIGIAGNGILLSRHTRPSACSRCAAAVECAGVAMRNARDGAVGLG